MKKSELRQIIRESIKQQLTEDPYGNVTGHDVTHVYEGCGFINQGGSGNGGVGSTWGTFKVNQNGPNINQSTTYSQQIIPFAYAHNNNVIHNMWGAIPVGNVVKFKTCNPLEPTCESTCLIYKGEDPPNSGHQYMSYGVGSNLAQVWSSNTYISCAACAEDHGAALVYGCIDLTACNYDPAATTDDGSCLPDPVCNTDICLGDTEILDPLNPCNCIVDVVQILRSIS